MSEYAPTVNWNIINTRSVISINNTEDTPAASIYTSLSVNGNLSTDTNTFMNVSGQIQGTQLISSVATGTAPFVVSSTTLNTNLNAEFLGGHNAAYFQPLLTNPVTGTGTSGYIPKFTGTGTLGNSPIFTDGTNVGFGIIPSSPWERVFQIYSESNVDVSLKTSSNEWHLMTDANGYLGIVDYDGGALS